MPGIRGKGQWVGAPIGMESSILLCVSECTKPFLHCFADLELPVSAWIGVLAIECGEERGQLVFDVGP